MSDTDPATDPATVRRPAELQAAIDRPYDPDAVYYEPPRSDGFRARNVRADEVIRSLRDCGDHDVEVLEAVIDHQAAIARARVRITFRYFASDPSGKYHLVREVSEGVGAVPLRHTGEGPIETCYDLKAAVSDGLKLAAKHAGKGLHLWDRGPDSRAAAGTPAAPQPAAGFQLDQVRQIFERSWGWPESAWLGAVGLGRAEDLDHDTAARLIDGTHPVYAQVGAQPPPVGMTPSAAR